MKKIKFILNPVLFIAFIVSLILPAEVLSENNIKEIDVNGVKVILKNTGKDVISVRLFVTGGTANYPIEKQGIESLTYDLVIKGGTASMPKADFLALADKLGTNFGSSAALDFGEINMLCLGESFDKSWQLFTDAILNPAFDEHEFTVKKEQFMSFAKQNESDPDEMLEQLTFRTAFKGKNYEKNPNGTFESLGSLTLDDLKAYYRESLCKKRVVLVVAGNVDENNITEKVRSTLSKLPDGNPPNNVETVKLEQPAQDIVDRKISTNYLCGIMSGIPWNSPDAVSMMVAMYIMYDRYFIELRTKRSLSYAPAAIIYQDAITSPFTEFYITTDHPKEAMQVMVDIINDVRKNGFTEEELTGVKNQYLTSYFMRLETAETQTLNIGRWYLRGNMKAFEEFEPIVKSVTIQEINRVFISNTGSIKWDYLGDQTKVSPEDFKQIDKIGF